MKCTYNDGTKITYSGPFQMIRGQDVNVFIKDGLIPGDIKDDLEMALYRNSCSEMRSIGDKVAKRYGAKACVHE